MVLESRKFIPFFVLEKTLWQGCGKCYKVGGANWQGILGCESHGRVQRQTPL